MNCDTKRELSTSSTRPLYSRASAKSLHNQTNENTKDDDAIRNPQVNQTKPENHLDSRHGTGVSTRESGESAW
jgi:hypothetical protein